jgi:redox-sensitive bicupin YhaK (pirin superfamily)
MHSEQNAADSQTHFLQIWIQPSVAGIAPGYEQKHFDADSKRGVLRLIASPDGRDGSVLIHQDAYLYATLMDGGRIEHKLADGRRVYVHVVRGSVTVNGESLETGDALKAADVASVVLENAKNAEVLLFDLD